MSVDPHDLSLVYFPSPVLRQPAVEVDPADPKVHAVARRLIEVMCQYNGVGLAAPQVGLSWRIFVTRPPQLWESQDQDDIEGIDACLEGNEGVAWINPALKFAESEYDNGEEGCLSLPDIRGSVRRASEVMISGYDIDGNYTELSSDKFIARVWQHEYDHLDGILIIDKMSAMDKLICRRQIRQLERAY